MRITAYVLHSIQWKHLEIAIVLQQKHLEILLLFQKKLSWKRCCSNSHFCCVAATFQAAERNLQSLSEPRGPLDSKHSESRSALEHCDSQQFTVHVNTPRL